MSVSAWSSTCPPCSVACRGRLVPSYPVCRLVPAFSACRGCCSDRWPPHRLSALRRRPSISYPPVRDRVGHPRPRVRGRVVSGSIACSVVKVRCRWWSAGMCSDRVARVASRWCLPETGWKMGACPPYRNSIPRKPPACQGVGEKLNKSLTGRRGRVSGNRGGIDRLGGVREGPPEAFHGYLGGL